MSVTGIQLRASPFYVSEKTLTEISSDILLHRGKQ